MKKPDAGTFGHATLRDGRTTHGLLGLGGTAFLSDTYIHEPGTPHGSRQEVFGVSDILVFWSDDSRRAK